jgi:thiol-disulfide isomerase/thioredoxin
MTAGAWVLIVAVAAAIGFGVHRAAVDGRFRGTHELTRDATADSTSVEPSGQSVVDPSGPSVVELVETTGLDLRLGGRATLLQFSSAFCAPCRATRRTLADIAAAVPGVAHVEVDAEHHLELVRRLGILRTPTTLILDGRGVELSRAAGAPRKEQVLAALAAVT